MHVVDQQRRTPVAAGSLDAANAASAVANISVTNAIFAVTGDATVADDGTGVLSVLSGATFSAANLTIGSRGDSSGAVVVSGKGSVIDIAGALNVGTALGTGESDHRSPEPSLTPRSSICGVRSCWRMASLIQRST